MRLDNLERLSLLTNTNNHARLHSKRRNIYNLAINYDMLVTHELTGSCTSGSDTKTEHHIVESALQILEKHLTGDAFSLGCLLKHITELALEHTVGVLGFLLLCQHDTILRLLTAAVVAMLSRGEVPAGQNFVGTENGFSKTARNF